MRISILSPNLSGCVSILDCGVTYLATFVNQRTEHSATIWDYTFRTRDWQNYTREKFKQDKPDVIGITYTTLYQPYVLEAIREIRTNLSADIPIVMGGYHPTLRPREALSIEGVDAVVIGEGEFVIKEYLDRLNHGKTLEGIPGLCYKNKDGQMFENERTGWITDLVDLPFPDYDLWDELDTYFYFLGQLWLIGSRGCPYKCTNCEELYITSAVPGRRYRTRDPENYVEEIKYHWDKYKDRGFRMAHPFDPVFPINRKWTKTFCDAYKSSGLSEELPFSIFSRGDTFYLRKEGDKARDSFDEERIGWLAEAGCKEIRIGIESGTERMRNEVHFKKVSNKQLIETFGMCRKYKINTIAYNMIGGPTETTNEMWETFKFNLKVKPDKPIFFIYQLLAHEVQESTPGQISNEKKDTLLYNPNSADPYRNSMDTATIQFGEPIDSETFSKKWVVWFQLFCYAYFVGKRVIKLFLHQPIMFFPSLISYMYRGYKRGANMKIVFAYFLGSARKNLFL